MSSLITLPFFISAALFLFWSTAIGGGLYKFKWLHITGKRKDTFEWARLLVDFFGLRIKQLGTHGLYKGGRCIYLCNQRSWADFFIDVDLTQGLAAPMSRALVFYVL